MQWSEKARGFGHSDLAEILKEIAVEAQKMDRLFEKAKKPPLSISPFSE